MQTKVINLFYISVTKLLHFFKGDKHILIIRNKKSSAIYCRAFYLIVFYYFFVSDCQKYQSVINFL